MVDDDDQVDDDLLAEQYSRDEIVATALAIDVADKLRRKDSALRTVIDRALADAKVAVRELIHVDPTKTEAVRQLQWQVTRFEDLCTYVSQILADGREATPDLSQESAERLERLIRKDDEPSD